MRLPDALGACRTLVVDSENRPRRGCFLPDSPPHGYSMGQESGKKGAGAVDLQPTIPKSDRLLARIRLMESRLLRAGATVLLFWLSPFSSAAPAPVPQPVAPSALPPTCVWWLSPQALPATLAGNAGFPSRLASDPSEQRATPNWFAPVPGWQALNAPFGVVAPCYPAIRIAPPVYWSLP